MSAPRLRPYDEEPTLVFLNNVSQTEWGYASIPHARHVAQHGKDYGVVPSSVCGTGPFRLKEWVDTWVA